MKFSKYTGCFYPDDIHYENPPADLIEVTQDDYTQAMNRAPGETLDVVKGKLVMVPAPTPDPVAVVAAAKANVTSRINAACETEIASIQAAYPASEVLSWPKQEAEARAYAADPAAATPLLDALAEARGIDKATLAERVILKADTFARLSGAAIGKRQALEDALNALPEDATPEQIAAIVW